MVAILFLFQTMVEKILDDIEGLKIIHLNIRSLVPKIDMLCAWVYLHKSSIITPSKTFLNSDISDSEISLTNYVLYRVDRITRPGGVAIHVSVDIACEIITSFVVPQGFESVFLKIVLHRNKCLHIGNIYRPPSSPVDCFRNMISYFLYYLLYLTSIPAMN